MKTPRLTMRNEPLLFRPRVRPMGCDHWQPDSIANGSRPGMFEPIPIRDQIGIWLAVSGVVLVEIESVIAFVRWLFR